MRRSTSLIAVFISSACYATLAILATNAYRLGATPLQMLVWRFTFASALVLAFVALRSRRSLAVGWRTLGRYATLSLTGYGAGSLCFFFALEHAPASVVAVLLYTYPAMIVLAERLFEGVALTRARAEAVLLTFAGCVLVLEPWAANGSVGPVGVALGLGAGAGYAAFSFLSSALVRGGSRLVLLGYVFGMSAILMALIAGVAGVSLSPLGWTPALWALLGAIVVIPTFLAAVLYLDGVRGLGAGQAAVVASAEPVFTMALAAALLGERLGMVQLAGAALVVVGVAVAEMGRARPEGPAPV